MNVSLFENNKIVNFELPVKVLGDFWLKDSQGSNMVNISAVNGNWELFPSKNTKIYDANGNTENIILKIRNYYIVEKDNNRFLLFCNYLGDLSFKNFLVKKGVPVTVGSDKNCNICIPLSNILPVHVQITFQEGFWNVVLPENSICYLNDKRIKENNINVYNGDLINIYGFKIYLINGSFFVNNPFKNIVFLGLEQVNYVIEDELSEEEIEDIPYYDDDDYFLKSPRVRSSVDTFKMKIDAPPSKEEIQDVPLWATMAPMLTMVASSSITLSNAIMSYLDGEKTFTQILPTLIISGCMVFTMLIWPNINKKIQKRNKIKKEEERQAKYRDYISKKDRELLEEYERQKRIIEDNVLSTDVCYDMIINKRRTLWSRRKDQDDFLNVRVGIGDEPFDAEVSYSMEDFTMENDGLKTMVDKLISSYKIIKDVPMSYSFLENPLTGINGLFPKYLTFTSNIILQLMSFHSYDDLKFVIFTNDDNKDRWDYLRDTPYCFSNDKSIRFFATNADEMQEVSNYLEQILSLRQTVKDNKYFDGHYIIFIDDIDCARRISIVNKVLNLNNSLGFSLVILEEKLSKVPSEVSKFLVIGEKTSIIWDMTNNEQRKFIEETNTVYNLEECSKILSNLPLYMEAAAKQLPSSITFLETFGVGKIEQLNILNRWKQNNPTKTLKAEIGANVNGDSFILDLHEKAHGPHGLVAGMTGSGKSEFIITYVLSMAVNYSPEEVQFVLIDYKGGGLASAFVDSETGVKIPHIAGTITNLDKSEINRALASINSELRRRQSVFNEVKMKTGEGTIDIYKYQRLYRDGVINEPMSHLIIVCDEFAELKSQQPDFMNDLVSAARIGRSLGVHLILATQKPSGVVDAQIWSNAKFKVCLKVQDKQDSNEMIRNDLAAEIKQVGRFYLLVGYNEFFSTGQSAWAGAQYCPSSEFKKNVDKNIYSIDNVGSVSKSINNVIHTKDIISQGEELTNIVKYLISVGKESEHLKLKQLWLDKIPANVYVDDLKIKYNYKKEDYVINPIIGEFDNPTDQVQGLLTINFSELGHSLVYGVNESGKDELVQTLTYSLIDSYSSDEVNIYLIDFGAETLINFIEAPQVADVVLSSDEEKLFNLLKFLSIELNNRKKKFTAYGGSYEGFLKHSGEKLPNIIVTINSFDVMCEIYQDMADKFAPIIRDGSKYGIYFFITADNPGSIKFKIVQSCKNIFCLQLANESYYRDLLGRGTNIIPANNVGRGLIKLNETCEFQTALVSKNESFYNFIKSYITKLSEKGYKKVPPIYIMPEEVDVDKMMSKYEGLNSVPVGIYKETLNSALFDFSKRVGTAISSSDSEYLTRFIKNFIYSISLGKGFTPYVIDANKLFESFDYEMTYINEKFDVFVDSLVSANDKIVKLLEENDHNPKILSSIPNIFVTIIGVDKFFSKLDDDHKKAMQKIILDNKEEPKINFAFIDSAGSFKKYEYEEWYKNGLDNSNGIWVGPSFSQQFVLRASTQNAKHSAITEENACILKNGNIAIAKLINKIK
ncbi:MAG: type VII secretion protein EssC [Bacilli bacterium]|nr:type VII secretion protein EssC [Bacilli bacterium]